MAQTTEFDDDEFDDDEFDDDEFDDDEFDDDDDEFGLDGITMPTEAFDISVSGILDWGRRRDGWCFALPPGISPEQWPLSYETGFPMTHSFTLKLPPMYRSHGEDFAALCLFTDYIHHSQTCDRGEIDHVLWDELNQVVGSTLRGSTSSEALRFFAERQRKVHPQIYRLQDPSARGGYAVILLTEDEFNGTPCQPPILPAHELLLTTNRPLWLDSGWAHEYHRGNLPHYLVTQFGEPAEAKPSLDFGYSFDLVARNDPNAGKITAEVSIGGVSPDGYASGWYRDESNELKRHSWAERTHAACHLGGTMFPAQHEPRMSPFYIEFEEFLGGFNFGTGNARLDFHDMRLEWSC